MTTREESAHFERLATVGDITRAQVLAARLRSEGIEVRLHSEAFGPYPMTVGDLARTELWVLSDRIEDANEILLEADTREAIAPADPELEPRVGMPLEFRLIALALGIVLFALVALRFARVY